MTGPFALLSVTKKRVQDDEKGDARTNVRNNIMDPLRYASRMTDERDSVKNNWILRANALWMTTMSTRFYALLRMTKKKEMPQMRHNYWKKAIFI